MIAECSDESAGFEQSLGRLTQLIDSSACDLEDRGEVSAEIMRCMADEGFFGSAVPRRFAGLGLDPIAFGRVCEELGRLSGSVLSLFTVHTMVSAAISRWGSGDQRADFLPGLANGSVVAAFALTEPGAGSDVDAVATQFTRDGDRILISGEKCWISFGMLADLFLVVGRLDGQVAGALVPRSCPRLRVTPSDQMFGFRAAMLASISFDGCSVPAGNLLGSPSFGLAQIVGQVLDHGRYCIAWGCAGLARACLEASASHVSTRVQFGAKLIEFQLIQEQLADLMTASQSAWLMCMDAARARAARTPDMIVRTAAAKYYAAKVADMAASKALQMHGAVGLARRHPVHRYVRDAKVMNIIEGSSQVHAQLLGKDACSWVTEMAQPSRWNRR